MDKRIQEVVDFVTAEKNRTTVIAAAAVVAVIAMIAGGKAKR